MVLVEKHVQGPRRSPPVWGWKFWIIHQFLGQVDEHFQKTVIPPCFIVNRDNNVILHTHLLVIQWHPGATRITKTLTDRLVGLITVLLFLHHG